MREITGIEGEIWLHDVVDMEQLDITTGGHINNLHALSELTNLQSLSIDLSSDCDCGFIQNLPKIERLEIEIEGYDNVDLEPLKSLPMLSELWVVADTNADIEVNNMNVLGSLPKLKELHLVDIKHVDFSFLQDTVALEQLFLNGLGPLKNIKYLSSPPRLKYLELDGLLLKNVDFIQYLKAIEEINITENLIFDTAGLSALKKIKKVHLQGNELSSLSEAEELPRTEDFEGNVLLEAGTRYHFLNDEKDYWKIEEQ